MSKRLLEKQKNLLLRAVDDVIKEDPPKEKHLLKLKNVYQLINSEETPISICENCETPFFANTEGWVAVDQIENLFQRIAPGEPMPIGECPVCGILLQVNKKYKEVA